VFAGNITRVDYFYDHDRSNIIERIKVRENGDEFNE
jgi:hypothetical protein